MKTDGKISKRHYLISSLSALFFLIGCVGILVVAYAFKSNVTSLGFEGDDIPAFLDNFNLFRTVSLYLCGILLALSVISTLTYLFVSECRTTFFQIVAEMSPILCALVVLGVGVFFSYLASGGEHSITPYVICMSVFEALTFALPFSISGFIKLAAKKSKGN